MSSRGGGRAASAPLAMMTPATAAATARPSSSVNRSPSQYQPPSAETTGASAPKAAAFGAPKRAMATE